MERGGETMRKLVSALLLTALLFALLPMGAGAAAEITVEQTTDEVTYTTDKPTAPILTIVNTAGYDVTVTVQVYDELQKKYIYNEQFLIPVDDSTLVLDGFVYKPLERNGQINTYHYRVTTPGGFRKNLYFVQTMHIDRNTNQPYYTQVHNSYLPRNTVSSFGPQFRVISPSFTKKWYMFTPIDLSIQGRQTFTLVASNMYEIGEVYVDVFDDTVNLSYSYYYDGESDKIEPVKDFVTIYKDYAEALEHDPDTEQTSFAFGQPFSITNQLDGDTNVLMFIRNNLTYYRYPMPTKQLSRNYPNSEARKAERGAMLALMDPVEGVDLVNSHNYGN
jgi:hypothetical protein